MTPSASLAAFRFGYGLPLPEGAPVTPDAMLAALAGPDEAAQRFAIPGYDWVHRHVADVARNKQAAREDALLQARLDAVVQCGTNMSMTAVAERLEPKIGIPILGINATLLWHALRETGITERAEHAGRLLREH